MLDKPWIQSSAAQRAVHAPEAGKRTEYIQTHRINTVSYTHLVQDPPYAVNQDYDAVSFSQRLGKKSGKFSMKIDKKELDGLTLSLIHISSASPG